MIREVYLILLVCAAAWCSQPEVKRPLTTHERIVRDGYPSQYFDVITEDGYILEINRIPRGKNDFDFRPRPVVFLQHGLQNTANAFLGLDVETSLAYNLADRGFDVWLGNTRGVQNSRRHVELDPDDFIKKRIFWNFSFEDIALKDLPSMIDFVLDYTKQKKLHYVGHSQGGTVFLALTSRKPEYNDKFQSVHLMAGVGYQNYFPDKVLKFISDHVDPLLSVTYLLGFVEILGPRDDKTDIQRLDELVMANEYKIEDLAEWIKLIKQALDEINRFFGTLGGAAIKQYAHYGQNIRDKTFRSWNHGWLGNLFNYGSVDPPIFDLTKITADITMHYTLGDNLLGEGDVLDMAKDIRNCKVRKVPKDDFSHTDFVQSKEAKELVLDYIIDDLLYRK